MLDILPDTTGRAAESRLICRAASLTSQNGTHMETRSCEGSLTWLAFPESNTAFTFAL